jgi:hypothetical protein
MDAAGARALKDRIEAHQASVARRLRAIARGEQAEGARDPDESGPHPLRAGDDAAPAARHDRDRTE